ncbi:hypothetical protein ACQEWB_35300 [Streptomyces sp. CA-249302]|uniref:hypothetical protein n=1 Tax=Streptomyces sp. CA-249302 TaxID=3240058 RepID=UPI003D8F6F58
MPEKAEEEAALGVGRSADVGVASAVFVGRGGGDGVLPGADRCGAGAGAVGSGADACGVGVVLPGVGAVVPLEGGVAVPLEDGVAVPLEGGMEVAPEEGMEVPPEDGMEVPPEDGMEVPPEVGLEVPLGVDAFRCTGRGAALEAEAGPGVPGVPGVGVALDVRPVGCGAEPAFEAGPERLGACVGEVPAVVVRCTGAPAGGVCAPEDAVLSPAVGAVEASAGVPCGAFADVPVLLEAPGARGVVALPVVGEDEEAGAEWRCTAGAVEEVVGAGGLEVVDERPALEVPPRTGRGPEGVAEPVAGPDGAPADCADVPADAGPLAEPPLRGPLAVGDPAPWSAAVRWTVAPVAPDVPADLPVVAPPGAVADGPAASSGTAGPTPPRSLSVEAVVDPPEAPAVPAPDVGTEACRDTGRVRRCTAPVPVRARVRDCGRDGETAGTGFTRTPVAGGTDTAGDPGPVPVTDR